MRRRERDRRSPRERAASQGRIRDRGRCVARAHRGTDAARSRPAACTRPASGETVQLDFHPHGIAAGSGADRAAPLVQRCSRAEEDDGAARSAAERARGERCPCHCATCGSRRDGCGPFVSGWLSAVQLRPRPRATHPFGGRDPAARAGGVTAASAGGRRQVSPSADLGSRAGRYERPRDPRTRRGRRRAAPLQHPAVGA